MGVCVLSTYHREYQRRRRRDPDARTQDAEWARRYRARHRADVLRKYGLTPESYDALLEDQGGGCAICGRAENTRRPGAALPVDHCHETGEVRGILCDECNLILGIAKDDPSTLRKAAAYLERRAAG